MNLLKTILPNQLVQNGNFADGSNWSASDGTMSISNGIATYTTTASTSQQKITQPNCNIISGRKYYISAQIKPSITISYGVIGQAPSCFVYWKTATANIWNDWGSIATASSTSTNNFGVWLNNGNTGLPIGTSAQIKNAMLIDLTELYGAGLEPTSVAQFRADYPLDYYPYSLTNTTGLLTCANGAITADISSMLPSGIGVVDLGSLNWTYNLVQGYHNYFEATVSDIKQVSGNIVASLVCSNYDVIDSDNLIYGSASNCSIASRNNNIRIYDTNYNDAVSFKSAMSGQLLFYKKNT